MTEHVCEWECAEGNFYAYQCTICGAKVTRGWALSRVNATERLTADAAWGIANRIYQSTPQVVGWEQALRAYADTLEGK